MTDRPGGGEELRPLWRGRDLATEMNLIKVELGRLGLFKTMHAMDEATRAFGYELADKIDRALTKATDTPGGRE